MSAKPKPRANVKAKARSRPTPRAKAKARTRPAPRPKAKVRTRPAPRARANTDAGSGTSDAAVQAATGRGWEQWFAAIDRMGGADMTHRDIARRLRDQGLGNWWSQMVTVSWERARGRRVLHQSARGFAVSRSRTYDAPMGRVWRAWADEAARATWLKRALERKPTTRRGVLRFELTDGTKLLVAIAAKAGRTTVTLDHSGLANATAAAKFKAWWSTRLATLGKLLAG